jgi:Cu/Ag efflux protein CusF
MGMQGLIVVGRGSPGTDAMIAALEHGPSTPEAAPGAPPAGERHGPVDTGEHAAAAHLFHGVGTLKAVDRRVGRIIVAHKQIPGFMAAMTMSYLVEPADLLAGFNPGDRVNFTIDAEKREIVALEHGAKQSPPGPAGR